MTQRSEQLSSLVHHNLNDVFVREVEFPLGTLATVTKVEVTPDLSWAIVKLSILPISKQGTVLKKISQQQKRIQHSLNKTLHLRKFPQLRFKIDDTELQSRKIDRELEKD